MKSQASNGVVKKRPQVCETAWRSNSGRGSRDRVDVCIHSTVHDISVYWEYRRNFLYKRTADANATVLSKTQIRR
jgi:hypothetical protein